MNKEHLLSIAIMIGLDAMLDEGNVWYRIDEDDYIKDSNNYLFDPERDESQVYKILCFMLTKGYFSQLEEKFVAYFVDFDNHKSEQCWYFENEKLADNILDLAFTFSDSKYSLIE